MTDNLPEKIYTETDLARAKRNSKVVGWVQGGLVVFLAGFLLQFISWIPIVVGAGAVGWIAWKLLGGKSKEGGSESP